MYLHPNIRDNGLQYLTDNGNRLDVCSQEPTTYTQATSTYTLGNWTGFSIGAPADRAGGGREVTVPANGSAGNGTANGTPTHYAIVDTVNSRLLVVNTISNPTAVVNGNPFDTSAFKIGMPTEVSG